MVKLVLVFAMAFLVALEITPLVRRWARRRGKLDFPDARKLHATPVPRLGGVGIYLAVLLWLVFFSGGGKLAAGLLVGTTVLFGTGLIDDLFGLKASQKFLGQIIAALATIELSGLRLFHLGDLFGTGDLVLTQPLATLFTVFAIVGLSNAMNMMDGLDGLAGGIGAVACLTFAILGLESGNHFAALGSITLLGALLGFLRYNHAPARIYLGDCGSLLLGFLLGFLAVDLTQQEAAGIGSMVPVVILALPVFDALRVMAVRLIRRQNPFAPDRRHLHHLLLDLGLEPSRAVLVLYGLAAAGAFTGLIGQTRSAQELLLMLVGGCLAGTLFFSLLLWWTQATSKPENFVRQQSGRLSTPSPPRPTT